MLLREYQLHAVEAVEKAWSSGVRRPAVVMPTGTGKTIVLASLCSRLVHSGYRPLLLVNRDELCVQSVDKLLAVDPMLSVGIIKAEKDETECNVTVASVQTLSRQARMDRIGESPWDVVICDEAHFVPADSWQRVLTWAGCFDPDRDTLTVGFSATLFRTDKKVLGDTFDEICFELDTQWAIESGMLVPVRAQRVKLPDLDLAKVRQQNGDYQDGDLGKAMAQADACPIIAAAYNQHGRSENGEIRRGIIFAPTVELAHCLTEEFRLAGIPTETVIGTTPLAERRRIYSETASGENKVISSVGVLVYGFDLPPVEVAVMARPTKSPLVYIQAAGRVLRPSPSTGKTQALILDVVGASRIGLACPTDLGMAEVLEVDEDGVQRVLEGVQRRAGLLPPAPAEIEFVEVDPFAGIRKKYTPRGRTPWLLTRKSELPFLPGSQTKPTVFLYPGDEALWSVYAIPVGRGAKVEQLRVGLPFPLAVAAAREFWGAMPGKQHGEASANQRLLLSRFGVCYAEDIDKQEASDLISTEIVSRRIDR